MDDREIVEPFPNIVRYMKWLTPPNDEAHPPACPFFAGASLPLLSGAPGFHLGDVRWLADAALLAYSDEPALSRAFTLPALAPAGGAKPVVRTFDGEGTRAFVATVGHDVLVAFRGTQVFKLPSRALADVRGLWRLGGLADLAREGVLQLGQVATDWLTDAKVRLVPRDGFHVHGGFADAFDAVWPGDAGLGAHLRTLAADPARRFWFTGHSLGGALATLAAWTFDQTSWGRGRARLHTFGSPRVGDRAFHDAFTARFPDDGGDVRAFRLVHATDLVATVPHVGGTFDGAPALVHVGRRVEVMPDGVVIARTPDVRAVGPFGEGSVDNHPPGRLADHAPLFYASLLWNAYRARGELAVRPE